MKLREGEGREEKGKERKGKERKGKERKGKERKPFGRSNCFLFSGWCLRIEFVQHSIRWYLAFVPGVLRSDHHFLGVWNRSICVRH